MVEEVLNIHRLPSGESVDDDDIVIACPSLCRVGADETVPAGDNVAAWRSNSGAGLGLS